MVHKNLAKMSLNYDVVVIGVGGVGSAAIYHLARQKARVIGLDRFPPGHDRGSSHGKTRIIRLAYFEHPNYVPLLRRAYELWYELEDRVQSKLFHQVGLLYGGSANGELISGINRSVSAHQLHVDELSANDVTARWPGYRLPDSYTAIFEKDAGYLLVEDSVKAQLQAAVDAGAEVQCGIAVRRWRTDGRGVSVETDQGTFSADRLVITAGAWAGEFLDSLNIPLRVLRKALFWYEANTPAYHVNAGCPCFLFETLGGMFYGFPQTNELGLKLAEHSGGELVQDPLFVDRRLRTEDQKRVEACLERHLPGMSRNCTAHSVCMYTMSPDEHFVVGCHPDHPQVVFSAGLSGHGFKFASVLGEIMAELALNCGTRHNIEFLSPKRFTS
jgi:sarcosine oxidase